MDEQNLEFQDQTDTINVIKTDEGAKDGQNKCPRCGATDISLNMRTGKLRCNFCRHEFEPQTLQGMETDISQLHGETVASGTQDILADAQDIVTLKCSSCGAEVVINTAETTQARCHWCRNTLSLNQQMPNGSIPDAILPFSLTKNEAQQIIEGFVQKRKFFAHPKFKEEFTTNNIMGVYFPYMIVDANVHAILSGQGEHKIREYRIGTNNVEKTFYDADLYDVGREFDLTIEGLTVESNSDRLNKNNSSKTNNVINAIMPFDIENCIKYDSNYLKGYTSERRDTNIDDLREIVNTQAKDIVRYVANDTLQNYDRGVRWINENVDVKGQQWKSAYLPVWLYSYQQKKSDNTSVLHYVAVNARTREVMGSVPIHMPRLLLVSFLVELLGILAMLLIDFDYNFLFLLSGIIYFIIYYSKYRNTDARHYHEKETKTNMFNLLTTDVYVKRLVRLPDPKIKGANNTKVNGSNQSKLSNFTNTFMN